MRYFASIICLIALLWCSVPLMAQHRQITRAEYFWDVDPGNGNAIPLLATDGNFDNALEAVFQNTATLPAPGFHTLGVRVRAANGGWSPVYKQVIEILPAAISLPATLSVSTGEYYWGADPGEGNGVPLVAFNGNFDEALETVFAASSVPIAHGYHKISIRLRDVANNWGPVYSAVVQITNAPVALAGTLQVTAAELFWDADPGQGNGTALLALNGNFNEALETALISVGVPSAAGFHKLSIRVKDSRNNWGPVFSTVVQVGASTPANTLPNINVAAAEYYFDTDPGAGSATPMLAFDGNFDAALEKIMGASIPAPVAAGYHTLYMRVSDAGNKWGPAYGVVVYMDTTINFTATINGPTSLCPSALQGVRYTTPAIFGNTYNWMVNGGNIVSGQGTNAVTINWNTAGPHELILFECNVNTQYCDTAMLLFSAKPNAGSTVAQTICQGQSYLGYTMAGTYTDTFIAATGCDSIRTLLLSVNPVIKTAQALTLCNGQQYHGYSTGGVYVDTFAAATGCDSIRTLTLTMLPFYTTTVSRTLCYGDSYQGYSTTGTYIDTFAHATGCDSVRVLHLTILPQIKDTISITLCQGGGYAGYTASGTYTDTLSAINGCDSIRTLQLTVLPNATSAVSANICFGDSFEGHAASGVYTHRYTAANGCDSTRTITLTVRPQNIAAVSQTICNGQSYMGYTATGTYQDTFVGANGCDSIRILQLSVLALPHTVVNQTVCYGGSYLSYSTSGTYLDTFMASNGCDSIRTLMLTILPQVTSTSNIIACEGDVVQGYTQPGTYIDTFAAASGCDSIRTLQLTFVPQVVSSNKVFICQGDSIMLGDRWFYSEGMYQDSSINASGCFDVRTTLVGVKVPEQPIISVNGNMLLVEPMFTSYQWYRNGQPLTGETNAEIETTLPGKYTVQVTDDNACIAVSDAFELLETGVLPALPDWAVSVYPNPVAGQLNVKLLGRYVANVALYNGLGEVVYASTINHEQILTVDMAPLAAGVYYLKATSGNQIFNEKVIKVD